MRLKQRAFPTDLTAIPLRLARNMRRCVERRFQSINTRILNDFGPIPKIRFRMKDLIKIVAVDRK